MHIRAKFYGNLRRYLPAKKENAELDIEAGTTIAAFLERLQVPDSEVWMSAVNDTVLPPTTVLNEGDLLEVFEPVGGGAPMMPMSQ